MEISGSVADTLDDVGLACLGWWAEDWDGCPHFWGLVAAGEAARYATVDGTWRPLVRQSEVSRPTGLLRNQVSLANTDQGAVRVVAGEWDLWDATNQNQARGTALTMAEALGRGTIPALPSGSDISTAEYLDMSAEVSDVDNPNLWTDDTVFIPATVTPRSRMTPEPAVTWADWFADYAAGRTSSLLYLTISWTNPALVQEISIRFTVYARVRYNVARGLTVESDRASILRHGPRPFPSQPDGFAAYGQGGQAAALLSIFKGPPLVADLTIPLWYTAGLAPDPTSLRVGDRLRIAIPGTGWAFEAAVLTLRWQNDPGEMPTVRVLAIQAAPAIAVVLPDASAPTVNIEAVPSGREGTTVALRAAASGGTYDSLTYAWTVTAGRLDDATAARPNWTRPQVDATETVTIRLVVTAHGAGRFARTGTSAAAPQDQVTTTVTDSPPAATVPGAPTLGALVFGLVGAGPNYEGTITWTAGGGDPATSWNVEWTVAGSVSTQTGLPAPVRADGEAPIPPGTAVSVRVQGANGQGAGAWSTPATGTAPTAGAGNPVHLGTTANPVYLGTTANPVHLGSASLAKPRRNWRSRIRQWLTS